MERKLIEELFRNKELMGLNEDIKPPNHVNVSKDGTVNFFDLENKKAYRYKLVAKVLKKTLDVLVKSIDMNTGSITYVNPDTEKEETAVIDETAKQNIIQNFRNGQDFENLYSFKSKGLNVTINLNFVGEAPIIKKD
jgi:hypothetical protein